VNSGQRWDCQHERRALPKAASQPKPASNVESKTQKHLEKSDLSVTSQGLPDGHVALQTKAWRLIHRKKAANG
jgi:hypothetical protein